jgi:hypothetical protein
MKKTATTQGESRLGFPTRRTAPSLDHSQLFVVMAGLVPAIHASRLAGCKTWMPGTRPGMTISGCFTTQIDNRFRTTGQPRAKPGHDA